MSMYYVLPQQGDSRVKFGLLFKLVDPGPYAVRCVTQETKEVKHSESFGYVYK